MWEAVSSGQPTLILPDGCIDVIRLGDRLVVAGPDSTARLHLGDAGSTAIGLRFAPGQAPAALGVAADELTDQVVELSAIVGDVAARTLLDCCCEHGVPALERAFFERVECDGQRESVVAGLDRGWSVEAVSDRAGLSARQLQRRSLAWFGYGPKHLAKVLRLQRALAVARAGTALADTAAEVGYADQAHLARDVRSLTGSTMTVLLSV